MSRPLPFRSDVDSPPDGEPRVVEIDDDAADEVFDALSSRTTRAMLGALYESPLTAGDLSEATETTLQNVHYHLDKLDDAGLIEVVDTWYSEKGREMNVYAPTDSAVVLFSSADAEPSAVRRLFERLVGVLALVAVAGLLARAGFAVATAFADLRMGGGPDAGGPGSPPPDPPSPGVEALSPEFLAAWALLAALLVLLWRRWR